MILEACRLSKRYGTLHVLKDLDLSISDGQIVCLLGQNGAGKTTLIRILSGLLRPISGKLTLDGAVLDFNDALTRRRIGLILHQTFLYEHLTGIENLRFYARLYSLPKPEDGLYTLLERVGLATVRPIPVRSYSRGMKQRLTIARALIHDPQILLFDEPYTGLDQQGCAALNQFLENERSQNRLILLTTHELSSALQVATRFDVLAQGRIQASFANTNLSLEKLQTQYSQTLAVKPTSIRQVQL